MGLRGMTAALVPVGIAAMLIATACGGSGSQNTGASAASAMRARSWADQGESAGNSADFSATYVLDDDGVQSPEVYGQVGRTEDAVLHGLPGQTGSARV